MNRFKLLASLVLISVELFSAAYSQSSQWLKLKVSTENSGTSQVPLIMVNGVAYAIPSACLPASPTTQTGVPRQIGSSVGSAGNAAGTAAPASAADSGSGRQLGSSASMGRQLASEDGGSRQLGSNEGAARQLGSGDASRQLGSDASTRQLGSASADYLCHPLPSSNFSEISGVLPTATIQSSYKGAALRMDRQGNTIRIFF